jgi:hypothetical protein
MAFLSPLLLQAELNRRRTLMVLPAVYRCARICRGQVIGKLQHWIEKKGMSNIKCRS